MSSISISFPHSGLSLRAFLSLNILYLSMLYSSFILRRTLCGLKHPLKPHKCVNKCSSKRLFASPVYIYIYHAEHRGDGWYGLLPVKDAIKGNGIEMCSVQTIQPFKKESDAGKGCCLGSIQSAWGFTVNVSGELLLLDFLNEGCGHQFALSNMSILSGSASHQRTHHVSEPIDAIVGVQCKHYVLC